MTLMSICTDYIKANPGETYNTSFAYIIHSNRSSQQNTDKRGLIYLYKITPKSALFYISQKVYEKLVPTREPYHVVPPLMVSNTRISTAFAAVESVGAPPDHLTLAGHVTVRLPVASCVR